MASKQTVSPADAHYEQEIARLHARIARLEDRLAKTSTAKADIAAEKVKARTARQEARLLQKQNENLVALNKTKDEFIALTSHQLRTPATGTKQYLGMLLDGYAEPLGPRQRSYLQSAYDCNERQLRVVDDILRVAQVDLDKVVLRTQPTNLGQFLRQLLEEQTEKFERRDHVVNYQQPATTINADIDRDRLRMALDNIVDNADKYTEPGKRIELRLIEQGSYALIEIEDEGVGIDKSDFGKLFQKFSRIDNPLSIEVGGSGLGLYWAKRIIDMHGGNIEVRSKLDKGTVFAVRLPLVPSRAVTPARAAAAGRR
jgi:signal transduction histidine kinase